MTEKKLIAALASKVIGWSITPKEVWNPLLYWADAMELAGEFDGSIALNRPQANGSWSCKAILGTVTGSATEEHGPRAVTLAIARAVGMVTTK